MRTPLRVIGLSTAGPAGPPTLRSYSRLAQSPLLGRPRTSWSRVCPSAEARLKVLRSPARPGLRPARRAAHPSLPLGAHVRHAPRARPLLAQRRPDRPDRSRGAAAPDQDLLGSTIGARSPSRTLRLTASTVAPSGSV